ncbi:flagellar biosynthesis repressor FlbT [Sphingomonas psychrotolerans]|uniref:Flagellar biosynthesis repressor FlbT n=1 Tax=Sphingomonas psychrotolerans TaxID=1327635 RepID=A0A2K8MLL5_9SPHN|nr:flagellar biosynthesis repressor FlbT [Sphingomonas psychrotolerans]ATY32091.1 flagellar biosynthesis repressor FlbT [Sphingomonas psychrotolerans]
MLRITLRDGEKAIVNGAVLRAVGRTQIAVENQVSILRGREVMQPEEATTPARQLYFTAMLAYIDPANRSQHQDNIVTLIGNLVATLTAPEARTACIGFAHDIAQGEYYKALSAARELIGFEDVVTEAQAA